MKGQSCRAVERPTWGGDVGSSYVSGSYVALAIGRATGIAGFVWG